MKTTFITLCLALLLAVGFSACTSSKNGCNASSGMIGYK